MNHVVHVETKEHYMKLESLGLTICELTLDILNYLVSILLLSFRVVVS